MQGLPPGFVLDSGPSAPPATRAGGPRGIPGTGPKAPTPIQLEDQQFKREDQAMQRDRDAISRQQTNLSMERDSLKLQQERLKNEATGGIDASVEQGKAGGFALRAIRANANYEGAKLDPDSMIGKTANAIAPDITSNFSSDDRNAQRSREKDFIAAVLRYESGAAIPDSEYGTAYQIYFPSPNAGPKEIEAKRIARANAIEGLRLGAGPNVARIDGVAQPEMRGGVPVGTDVELRANQGEAGAYDRNAFLETRGLDPNMEATMMAFWNQNRKNEGLTPAGALRFYAENGIPPPSDDDLNKMIADAKAGYQFGPVDTSSDEAAYRAKLEQASQNQGDVGLGERGDQGLTLGLSDEAAGIGGAISSALRGANPMDGYAFSRDVERLRNEQADEQTGLLGDAVEIGAGLALPLGAVKTTGQAVKTGMKAGSIGGFGYGEGAEGSGLGAVIGTVAGGGLGFAGSRLGGALVNRASRKAEQNAQRDAVNTAAQDLGVNPPARMFTEPDLQNKARAVAGTIAGGSKVQRGAQEFSDEIEGAVANRLGQGGQALERPNAGAVAQQAFKRTDSAKKTVTDRLYDKYRKESGDPAVVPATAIGKVDEHLAKLNRSPETNKGEIAYLQSLRKDMTNGKMTVEALLDMRRNMRGQITERNLGLTQAEARVQDILTAAGDDVASALDPKSKGYGWLVRANKAHADRVVYKKRLMADLIGKDKDLPTDPGKAFETIQNWTNPRGDLSKLKALQKSFDPDEARDFAATTANAISRDNNGKFSATILLKNIDRLERAGADTIETLFGKDGAQALKSLKTLAAEQKRVSNAIAGQGSAMGNDWRSVLSSVFVPGGIGAVGSGGTTAIGMGVAGLAIKAGRDAMSAKMLLSPKVAKWAASAPKTNNPAAIDAHFAKLGAIAKAEPALAADIDLFRSAIVNAANDNAQRAVAQDGQSEGGR
jgi:hypothetical protein